VTIEGDELGMVSRAWQEGHLHFLPALLVATRRVFEHWLQSNSMLMDIDRGKRGTSSGGSGFCGWDGDILVCCSENSTLPVQIGTPIAFSGKSLSRLPLLASSEKE
jgi:hypothetical protein